MKIETLIQKESKGRMQESIKKVNENYPNAIKVRYYQYSADKLKVYITSQSPIFFYVLGLTYGALFAIQKQHSL